MRRLSAPLALLLFVGSLSVPILGRARPDLAGQALAPIDRPNIVLILTDDQRFDLIEQMPHVMSEIAAHGVTFENSFVVTPLCCPSRTTTLRGQYAHTTGIYQVGGPYGGYKHVHSKGLETETIATWLHAAGYHTALFGKYLNGYNKLNVVPPGWDDWYGISNQTVNTNMYFNYWQSENGVPVWHGSSPSDYSTDVIARQADAVIRATDPSVPLFISLDPRAPHAPTVAAPRYVGTQCPIPTFTPPPSSNEVDVSDKPAYVRAKPTSAGNEVGMRKRQCLSLRAVDDAVGTLVQALADTDRLSNTLIVITSDNGLMNTEHRSVGKKVPYESSIRVPLMVRYDPAGTDGTVDEHLVTNLDYASSFLELADATATVPQDGASFVPLLTGTAAGWRSDFLIEGYDDPAAPHGGKYVPTYCGVRTEHDKYVRYVTGESEYYDLEADPYELVNRASDPTVSSRVGELRARLAELCSPRPPGLPPI
jgi:N-acetylglucosamine-6-sulfatase